jgi:cytochrome c peroxidase
MNFADNLPLAHGIGTTSRRTMPLIGVAYSTWLFWDGRKDSLWAQALGPIESSVEHGFTRIQSAFVIVNHYKKEYENVFGPLPDLSGLKLDPLAKPSQNEPSALKKWISIPRDVRDRITRIYVNMGKAIAAYVRTIVPGKSRFDEYVEALLNGDRRVMKKTLSDREVKGLKLFIGKAQCVNCHNGPLFTNYGFHNISVPQPGNLPDDRGRAAGIGKVLADEFNCLSRYSDAPATNCAELKYMDTNVSKYEGAFKTPTLRNVAERAPYMHAGQFESLKDVLRFYRDLSPEKRRPELVHGDLTDDELDDLEAFLHTLSAPPEFAE